MIWFEVSSKKNPGQNAKYKPSVFLHSLDLVVFPVGPLDWSACEIPGG